MYSSISSEVDTKYPFSCKIYKLECKEQIFDLHLHKVH